MFLGAFLYQPSPRLSPAGVPPYFFWGGIEFSIFVKKVYKKISQLHQTPYIGDSYLKGVILT